MAAARTGAFGALPEDHRDQLMSLAHEMSFETGERVFDEGGKADRFWIIRTGTVALDLHVPGRRAAVVATPGPGEPLGWSWLIPPRRRRLGGRGRQPGAPTSSTRRRSWRCAGRTPD